MWAIEKEDGTYISVEKDGPTIGYIEGYKLGTKEPVMIDIRTIEEEVHNDGLSEVDRGLKAMGFTSFDKDDWDDDIW